MRIYALCTVEAGADLLGSLRGRLPLAGVIGLNERPPSAAISGYVFMKPIADQLALPFLGVDQYDLSGTNDRRRLEELDIDLLLVCGWQRLIPNWLIGRCRIGAVGSHGSPYGISGGRGRSPQNWALILGAKRFSISIFFIDPGIDAGPIIATRVFPLDECDTIASSYAKATLATADMLVHSYDDGSLARRYATPQTEPAFYLPQRLPEDGGIDWNRPARDVARFIAALARPYPGAFSQSGGHKVWFWRARPLDVGLFAGGRRAPGEILLKTTARRLIVATADTPLMIDEYEIDPSGEGGLIAGASLPSVDYATQMKAIVERHRARYPDLPLAPDILRAAGVR